MDTLIREPSPPSFLDLLAEATLTPPHLTKMPLDPLGNDDYVHPDVMLGGPRACGMKEQISTPYKNSNAGFENPTLFCLSATDWFSPSFVRSPLVPYPGLTRYNSDPDMFYDPSLGETIITWREVDPSYNTIHALTTTDGTNFIPRGPLFEERNHNAVSQTSVLEPDRSLWSMWYAQTGGGCSSSVSEIILREAVPVARISVTKVPLKVRRAVRIAQPGYVIWHIDVIRAEGIGYLMLAAAYPQGSDCGHSDLFLYVSENRIDWQSFAVPFMWRSMPTVKVKTLYRGSLLYNPLTKVLNVTFSAMGIFGHWDIWDAEYRLSTLLLALRVAKPADMPKISASRMGIDIPHHMEKEEFVAP